MNGMTRRGAGRKMAVVLSGLVLAGLAGFWWYSARHREAVFARPISQDTGGLKDNTVCLVCHVDLEAEDIVAVHLKAGIVCASCHGPSEVHRSDELNIMKPDVMFGRSDIGRFCKACHPKHSSGTQYTIFVDTWLGKRRANGRMVTKDSTCMDCHGNHAILRPEQQAAGELGVEGSPAPGK
jgi:hypothetical protein